MTAHDPALVAKAARAIFAADEAAGEWSPDCGDRELYLKEAIAVLDAVADVLRAEALREAALDWQLGGWADSPTRQDRVAERLTKAQHVCDWLRARADHIVTGVQP